MLEVNSNQEHKTVQRKKLNRKLDAIGWGLFFIWIGIAVLADVGWGIGLIGVGVIILGGLAAREYLSGSTCHKTSNVNC
jgi:hypothetical protein